SLSTFGMHSSRERFDNGSHFMIDYSRRQNQKNPTIWVWEDHFDEDFGHNRGPHWCNRCPEHGGVRGGQYQGRRPGRLLGHLLAQRPTDRRSDQTVPEALWRGTRRQED